MRRVRPTPKSKKRIGGVMALASDSAMSELDAGPKPLSLRRNFSWSFVGNVVYAGCQWGMLLVLAKLGSVESVGVFGFALAVTAPIIIFGNLQLRTVLATDANRQYVFGEYFALRLASLALGLSAISAVALLGRFPQETVLIILIIGLAKAIESISDIIYGLLLQNERMDQIARLQIIKGCLSLVAMGLTVYISKSVIWGAAAMAGTWALCLVAFDYPCAVWCLGRSRRHELRPRWNVMAMLHMARRSTPLGFAHVIESLAEFTPIYLIAYFLSPGELGIYVAISALMRIGNIAIRPVVYTTSPRLAQLYANGNLSAFLRLVTKIAGVASLIGLVGTVLALLFGRQLLILLYSPEYAEHVRLLVWIAIATTVSLVTKIDVAFIALRSYWQLLLIWGIGILSLVLISSVLIPEFHLEGAAIALFIANLIRMLMIVRLGWRVVSMKLAKETA